MTRKILFIVSLIVIAVSVYLYITFTNSEKDTPTNIIQVTLGIELPMDAKIQNFTYFDEGNYLITKISINEKDLDNILNQISMFCNDEKLLKQDMDSLPNFGVGCSWWDLQKEDIQIAFHTFVTDEYKSDEVYMVSHEVFIFVTKGEKSSHNIYISY